MDSSQDSAVLPAEGFPIRTSTDRSLVGGSPWLFAATHVLHRLSEPRHPPHALSSLVTLNSGLPSVSSSGFRSRSRSKSFGDSESRKRPRCTMLFYPSYSVVRVLRRRRPPAVRDTSSRMKTGGADRNRTDGLFVANEPLSHLSYSPLYEIKI